MCLFWHLSRDFSNLTFLLWVDFLHSLLVYVQNNNLNMGTTITKTLIGKIYKLLIEYWKGYERAEK